MAVHKGPASLRPRCTRSGSSVAAIPVSHGLLGRVSWTVRFEVRTSGLQCGVTSNSLNAPCNSQHY
jgi:hypothetical protein